MLFIVYAHIGIWGIWFLTRCEMCSMRALLKPPFPWCLELQLLQEKILNRISELGLDEQVSEMLCEMYQACFLALWFQLSLQHCAPKTNHRLTRKWDAMNLQNNGSEGTNISSIYEQSFHETCGQMNPPGVFHMGNTCLEHQKTTIWQLNNVSLKSYKFKLRLWGG